MASEKDSVVIVGGGVIGLFLALSLKEQVGIDPVVYEEKEDNSANLDSGLIMYPNGLRVLRDFNMDLLLQIREAGHVFVMERRLWRPTMPFFLTTMSSFQAWAFDVTFCI